MLMPRQRKQSYRCFLFSFCISFHYYCSLQLFCSIAILNSSLSIVNLQAELAALMYQRSRLVRLRGPDGRYTFGAVGEAEVVSAKG